MRSRVKNIKYIGKEDVYNMQVDKYHNFSSSGLSGRSTIPYLRQSQLCAI